MLAALLVLPLTLGLPLDIFSNDDKQGLQTLEVSKPLGDVSGLAVDRKGRVVAFHRAGRHWDELTFDEETNKFNKSLGVLRAPTIAVIEPNGKVVKELGENVFYLPHGMTIDREGHFWVTDVGSHQVHKLDGESGKVLLSLGEKLVPGGDEKHFCKPTDVAVASNGVFFVADGYCNRRVLKFSPSGELLDVIQAAIEEGEPDSFDVPHSLTLVEDMNMLCVADRDNERVQCFSAGLAEGTRRVPPGIPITSAKDIGRVFAIREKNHYLFGVTADGEVDAESKVFVMDMESGETTTIAKSVPNAHAVAVSDDGTVYVSQLQPSRIVRYSLA
ncbi:unnamed protein product [Caenorhabditis auriculariae]|uniref:peptidylamidoglycolate lyase n=1 Tax=Caenorhabditis auriculariae TaxID=2777116 RepID=A0A8S1GNH2_9PELO|nr:unnamed protein product [Caenorhabditis auriculariae]